MIVDVLRNDLGRVCTPGTVRVPRLCRLERTAAVQHLVSTVTGRLARGRDAFDSCAASFPGGSITGAPKIRAMELLEELEPVRRGPYTGSLGWIGPDGAMASSILIRTFVADGTRLSLHVGGGITYRSDAAAEWDETVAKARGPLSAIGAREVGLEVAGGVTSRIDSTPGIFDRRADRARRRPAPLRVRPRLPASVTASSRCSARGPAGRPSSTSTSPAPALRGRPVDPAATRHRRARGARRSRCCSRRSAWTARPAMRASASRCRAASSTAVACCHPTSPRGDDRRPGLARAADARRPPGARPAPRREPRPPRPGEPAVGPEDDLPSRLRLRATRSPCGRRRRRVVPDDRRVPVGGNVGEPVPGPRLGAGDARGSAARSRPARPASGSCGGRWTRA